MPIDWGVNTLRLSVFCADNTTASDATWKLLTGQDEAENRASVPGGRSFSGAAAGGILTLTHAGPRLDLLLQPKVTEAEEPELPLMGAWPDVRATFDKMAVPLLTSTKQPVLRLAVGAVMLAKSDTVEQSYEQLKGLLQSLKVDPKKMRDLHYRVNWAFDSKVLGLKVNRLTTWTSMRFTTALMQVTGDKLNVAAAVANELFAIRMECDHNTDAANLTPFPPNKIITIYQELAQLVAENAEKGEVTS